MTAGHSSADSDHAPAVEALQGVVERLTYHLTELGYTIARLKAPRTSELVTIVSNPQVHEWLRRCRAVLVEAIAPVGATAR